MNDAELHISHRVVVLCKVSRDRSRFFRLEFLNARLVFIHPVPERSLYFSNVLEATFGAVYNVNYISQFTSEFVFGGK